MFSVSWFVEVFINDKIDFIHIFTTYDTKGILFVKFELMRSIYSYSKCDIQLLIGYGLLGETSVYCPFYQFN